MKDKFLRLSERNKKEIIDYMPTKNTILKMACFFQNFSDYTRLRILTCLCMSELCVNDIAKLLNLNQTTVSHQLQILRSEKIVSHRREGKIVIYSLENKSVNDMMLSAVNNF
ncbi:MAG: metalloregulator ArsR/SmtB family transcription factor [Clostridia bacterium]|nr:metalloregulator ArsR/SmtB family transcription factor [Clostridia bacterium]MDD4685959.1 metalloregulator ArsR/SmtB family transcription factor [Clostridia bacterium]